MADKCCLVRLHSATRHSAGRPSRVVTTRSRTRTSDPSSMPRTSRASAEAARDRRMLMRCTECNPSHAGEVEDAVRWKCAVDEPRKQRCGKRRALRHEWHPHREVDAAGAKHAVGRSQVQSHALRLVRPALGHGRRLDLGRHAGTTRFTRPHANLAMIGIVRSNEGVAALSNDRAFTLEEFQRSCEPSRSSHRIGAQARSRSATPCRHPTRRPQSSAQASP